MLKLFNLGFFMTKYFFQSQSLLAKGMNGISYKIEKVLSTVKYKTWYLSLRRVRAQGII